MATNLNEGRQPVPAKMIPLHYIDNRTSDANLETEFLEPLRQRQCDIRFSAVVAPACHYRAHKLIEFRTPRCAAPRGIVEVLVQNNDARGCERGGYAR
jgi:hypothetical protein